MFRKSNTRNNNKQPNEDKIYHFIPKTTKTVSKKTLNKLINNKSLKIKLRDAKHF